MQIIIVIIFIVAIIATGGIYRTELTWPAVSRGDKSDKNTTSFSETYTAQHWIWGIVKGKQVDLELEMKKFIRPGEELASLSISTRQTMLDLFLCGVTAVIYCPNTVIVSGAIVRNTASEGDEIPTPAHTEHAQDTTQDLVETEDIRQSPEKMSKIQTLLPPTIGLVKRVQRALQKQGYDSGVIDGFFGLKTERAIRAFQKDHDLAITGKFDAETLRALHLEDDNE